MFSQSSRFPIDRRASGAATGTWARWLSLLFAGLLLVSPVSTGESSEADLERRGAVAAAPVGAEASSLGQVQRSVQASEYEITWRAEARLGDVLGAWQAPNRAQNFRTYFTDDGIRVEPRVAEAPPTAGPDGNPWEFGLALVAYGKGDVVQPVEPPALAPTKTKIDYLRGPLAEWYVNDSKGLEQGFTLGVSPDATATSTDPVFLEFEITGSLVPWISADGQSIDFASSDGGPALLHYAHLEVRDAAGRELPSWMALHAGAEGVGIRLLFDDTEAVYPVTVDPLLTTPAWTGEGDQEGAGFGYAVASAGDVNDDGYDDVIVGAPYYDNGQGDEGRVYVFHGSASGLETTPAWVVESNRAGILFGHAVAGAGDVNGDGWDDVIVGAPHYSFEQFHEGSAWVYLGSPTGLATIADWYAGGESAEALFGYSVAGAGDVNNDGYDDVVVGSPEYDGGQEDEGAVYVFHGSASGLAALESWMQAGGQAGAQFGYSVSTAGDVDGDDHDEIIVGAPLYDAGQTNEGAAFVYHGSSSGLDANPVWTREGGQSDARFGHSVSTAGNVNGDGYDDVIVGAPLYDQVYAAEGAIWVYRGSPSGLALVYSFFTRGYVYQTQSDFGSSVGSAGDVNGDGFDDIIVGTPLFDEGARPGDGGTADDGRAYVVLGSATGLDHRQVWGPWSTQHGARVGGSVAGAGDVNGDGFDDVIIGADHYDNGQPDEGHAFVFHGTRQVVTGYDLVGSLGFVDSEITSASWWTMSQPGQPAAPASSDSVSYGPTPGSVLITTGRAADGGLGSTDWADDGLRDITRFSMVLNVPPGAQVLRLNTQFITSEFDAGNPGRDYVGLTYQYYTGQRQYAAVGLDEAIEELGFDSINPPMSHAFSVQGKTTIGIFFSVDDEVNGSNDSALLLSNVYFSDVPLPEDIDCPADADRICVGPTHVGMSCSTEEECGTHPDDSCRFVCDIDDDGFTDYYGNPAPHDVGLRSGSYTLARKLLEVPGIGMPFNLSVLYNSGSVLTGAVGRKWSHSYDSYAFKLIDDDQNSYPDNIFVRHGTSLAEYFEESDGLGGYRPKFGGSHSTLTLQPDGTLFLRTRDHLTYDFTLAANEPPTVYLLQQVTDANGNSFTIQYDEFNRIASVTDTRGESFVFDFGDDVYLDRVEYPAAGTEIRFGYNDDYDLIWYSDPEGNKTHFAYDDGGLLLTATDAEGVVFASNTYDSYQGAGIDQSGHIVVSQRDGRDPSPWDKNAGVQISYAGESMTKTDRLGRQETRVYDVKGRLAKRIDRMDGEWSLVYDADDNVVSQADPRGAVTLMEYDGYGNQTSKNEAGGTCVGGANQGDPCAVATEDVDCPGSSCGSITTMTYDVRHNMETSTDHYDNTTTYTHDPANDNLLSEQDPLGNTVSYTYNAKGQKETEMTRRGNDPGDPVYGAFYFYTYDALGYVQSETDPLTNVTSYTYDELGHNTTVTNPRNHTVTYVYDKNGMVTSETNPLGHTTTHTYDRVARLIETREHGGATFGFSYTPTGKPERITDPLGYSIDHEYDAEERLVAQIDPLGRSRTFEYDDLDRLTRVVDRDGFADASATYDSVGNRTSVTDPNGNTTTHAYDLLGRATRETDPRCNTDPPDLRCSSGLLSLGKTYDGRGLLTSLSNQRNQQITHTYDDGGRLTATGLLGGDTISHVLDAAGNRTSSSSTRFVGVTRTFDARERMTLRTDTYGNSVGYQYDAVGNVEVLTYSDGKTVTYTYDELEHLIRVEDWNVPANVTTYTYDEVGNLIGSTLPDGSTVTYTYDAAHRLVDVSDVNAVAGTIFGAAYAYNAAGERTAADLTLPLDTAPAPDDRTFTHNAANEIADGGYAYDEDGNMLAGVFGGGARSMQYNELNQLVQIDADTFFYDVDGLRVRATRGGVTRRFVYDPTGKHLRLLEEQDDSGNIVARFVYGLGIVSREDASGNLSVYHFDGRGSTVALTDPSGAITDRYAYAPYGRVVDRTGTTDNPFTFNGRDGVVDDGNGLYFMRVRFYAPELMRFVQKDQSFEGFLQITQSLNRHAFVMGNPIQFVDPNGEVDAMQIAWLTLGGLAIITAASVASALGVAFMVGTAIVLASVATVWAVMYFVFGVEIDWKKLSYLAPIGWVVSFFNDVFNYDVVDELVLPALAAVAIWTVVVTVVVVTVVWDAVTTVVDWLIFWT